MKRSRPLVVHIAVVISLVCVVSAKCPGAKQGSDLISVASGHLTKGDAKAAAECWEAKARESWSNGDNSGAVHTVLHGANQLLQKEHRSEARPLVELILEDDPDHEEANLLMLHVYAGQIEQSVPYAEAAARSGSVRAFNALAGLLLGLERFSESLKNAKLALEQAPQDFQGNMIAGHNYKAIGKPALAVQHFEEADRVQPGDKDLMLLLAELYGTTGRKKDAMRMMKAVKKLGGGKGPSGSTPTPLNEREETDPTIRRILSALASHPDDVALYNELGIALKRQNRHADALHAYKKGLDIDPSNFFLMMNYGNMLRAMGNRGDALAVFERAAEMHPQVDGPLMAADVCREEGHYDKALEYYAVAAGRKPEEARIYNNMGGTYMAMRDYTKAKQAYVMASNLDPRTFSYLYNLVIASSSDYDSEVKLKYIRKGLALTEEPGQEIDRARLRLLMGVHLHELGDNQGALKEYDAVRPYSSQLDRPAEYWYNYGIVADRLSLMQLAIDCYHEALKVNPRHAMAWNNLGIAYDTLQDMPKAIEAYEKAVQYDPSLADALSNLGNAYKGTDKEKSARYLDMAIEANPKGHKYWFNKASSLVEERHLPDSVYYFEQAVKAEPNFDMGWVHLFHALTLTCNWARRGEMIGKLNDILSRPLPEGEGQPIAPLQMLVFPTTAAQVQKVVRAQSKAASHSAEVSRAGRPPMVPSTILKGDRRLRVGYVTSDLNDHPVGVLVQGIFSSHRRDQIHVHCIQMKPFRHDHVEEYIRPRCETYQNIHELPPYESAQVVNQYGINIAVNMNGYTAGHRTELFAYMPAPVTIMYLGFAATMGATFIQYYVTDPIVTPPALSTTFDEKLVLMPHSFMSMSHRIEFATYDEDAPKKSREDFFMPDGVILCSFTHHKVDPDTLSVWMDVMRDVPDSYIWLQDQYSIKDKLTKEVQSRGIDPNRIIWSRTVDKDEHLTSKQFCDIFLDTPLYNAHSLAADMLYIPLPIVTLPLEKFTCRVAAGLVANAGCPELIVRNRDEYRALVTKLAKDADERRHVRTKLRRHRDQGRMYDIDQWTHDWERHLKGTWESFHQHGRPGAMHHIGPVA